MRNDGPSLVLVRTVSANMDRFYRDDNLRRCFTQTSLDEVLRKRENEILYKNNILNGLDHEYRRQERILHELETHIHQVEDELDDIKEQRRLAAEKHQERRHKMRDVFRTWIRVRFAFQKN